MTLADYLAKNYLSADAKSAKKRKRKDKNEGLIFADEEANDWNASKPKDEEDYDGPTVVADALAGGLNLPAKKSKWITVGAAAPTDSEQLAADAILADAQAELDERAREDEDAPAVVEEGPMMANGAMAGLQTGEQVAAALERKKRADRKALKEAGLDTSTMPQETIYRDASGRIINVAMKRAELRAQAEEEAKKAAEELENRKGDVQKREKEERRQALQEAKGMTVARYADDVKLNEELKEQERWNDPMAQLLASKRANSSKDKRTKGGRATYQGAYEPNRYGIKPGWRWDGVDRSSGFERKWFAARNKAKDRKELEYAWQMDE